MKISWIISDDRDETYYVLKASNGKEALELLPLETKNIPTGSMSGDLNIN